ncbi:MAG: hypothetical protein ACO2OX_00090 [Candidatus Nanopusillus sp.]
MEALDYIIDSYDIYKQKLLEAFIVGVVTYFLSFIILIPVLGWYLYAKLFPKMVVWYYNKLNIKVDPKYDVAFKSIIILLLVTMIGFIIMIVGILLINSIIIGLIIMIIGLILSILLLYTLFGSIIGKVDKFKIYAKKSVYLFLISLIPSFILFLILYIILLLFVQLIGPILLFILGILVEIFYPPYLFTLYAVAIENMQS